MKKTLIALLLAVLMLCTLTAATAAELVGVGTSLYFSESGAMTVAEFIATPENRAYATWYGVLEFCETFGKSYNDLYMHHDTYVKSTKMGELNIFLPTCDLSGYYDLCWQEDSSLVTLYYESTSIDSLRDDPDSFLNDYWSDIIPARDTINAAYNRDFE